MGARHTTSDAGWRWAAAEIARHTVPLDEEALGQLAGILEKRSIAKGTLFLREGDIARSMGMVEKGMVRQFYRKKDYEITEHLTYEGHLFVCLESFINQSPSSLCVEALEDTVLYEIPYLSLHALMDKNPEIRKLYCAILESSLIISQRKADARRRQSAKERYCQLETEHPEIIKRVPQIYIASLLEMSPETLSRIRAGKI